MFVAAGIKYDISSCNMTVRMAVRETFAVSLNSIFIWTILQHFDIVSNCVFSCWLGVSF